MRMCVGMCANACTCACVFNPLARDIYLHNKLTLEGFTTVHLFGSPQSISFCSYIWNVLMPRWLWKDRIQSLSINNITEDRNVFEGVVHMDLFGASKNCQASWCLTKKPSLQLFVSFLARRDLIELIGVEWYTFELRPKSLRYLRIHGASKEHFEVEASQREIRQFSG